MSTITTNDLINRTPPPPPRPPSMVFTLPQLPTFESTWDFSQFRSQSPDLPVTPSPTRITSPAISPSKQFINATVDDYSPRSERRMCFPAPPPSPQFVPIQPMNDRAFREACTYASLAPSLNQSSTELSAVPGLTDSFTSTSYSSDEHTDSDHEDATEEDRYHASTNNAWNSYYNTGEVGKGGEQQDEVTEESYILPSAESCYALGFGKLGCPSTPSPVKSISPIRRAPTTHAQGPSPLRTRTAPSPAPVNASAAARPSMNLRRKDSAKSTRSTRTLTQQRYNNKPFEHPLTRHTTVSRPRPKHEASLSFTQALNGIPPQPALPAKFDSVKRTRSPPKDYTPPYLSLFPMSSRHSTPNGEMPPFPVPTRRAPRPVTAPCAGSTSTVHLIGAATTVLGSAGGAVVVEKSVWEEDSDDEEVEQGRKGKWHIRNLSGESKGSVRRREKEKWGKRSASDVVKGLFGLHH